jgi:hypothetical protein
LEQSPKFWGCSVIFSELFDLEAEHRKRGVNGTAGW